MAEVTAQYILETLDREIGDSFCEKCGFKKILRGPFDEYGLPLAPDEEVCEYNLDHPADDRCPKHRAYLNLFDPAYDLAEKIQNGGVEVNDHC